MKMSTSSNTIMGAVRTLLKRRVNAEPIIEVISLVAKNIIKVTKTIPKINLVTCPDGVYT